MAVHLGEELTLKRLVIEEERCLIHLERGLPTVHICHRNGNRLSTVQVNAHGYAILRHKPTDVVAVNIAVHVGHMVETLLTGKIHKRLSVTGEEHIVLRGTPMLQERVQPLNATPAHLLGLAGARDVEGAMAERSGGENPVTFEVPVGKNHGAAAVQS